MAVDLGGLTDPEPMDDVKYLRFLTNVVNHGTEVSSVPHAKALLDQHLEIMNHEQSAGFPMGKTVWFLYKQMLVYFGKQYDLMVAKQMSKDSDFVWIPYQLK